MFQKVLLVAFLSGVKFIFSFPVAIRYNFSLTETFLITTGGGIAGISFFAYLSDMLIQFYRWFVYEFLAKYPSLYKLARKVRNWFPRRKKKVFSNRSKRFIRIRKSYGLIGISVLTPFILSIPIGTFLAIRFYGRSWKTLAYLYACVAAWSIVISSLIYFTNLRFW
jgi:hypothetical protein